MREKREREGGVNTDEREWGGNGHIRITHTRSLTPHIILRRQSRLETNEIRQNTTKYAHAASPPPPPKNVPITRRVSFHQRYTPAPEPEFQDILYCPVARRITRARVSPWRRRSAPPQSRPRPEMDERKLSSGYIMAAPTVAFARRRIRVIDDGDDDHGGDRRPPPLSPTGVEADRSTSLSWDPASSRAQESSSLLLLSLLPPPPSSSSVIRHSGRVHVQGWLRQAWRHRYLELRGDGAVRYFEAAALRPDKESS